MFTNQNGVEIKVETQALSWNSLGSLLFRYVCVLAGRLLSRLCAVYLHTHRIAVGGEVKNDFTVAK